MDNLLVFTDLDGTLLDHHDYSYVEALPALEHIRQSGIPLIINSSKTCAEIDSFRKVLHNSDAFVVENGAAVFVPAGFLPDHNQTINPVILGRPLTEILPIIQRIREQYGFSFSGFSDYSVAEVVNETGLPEYQALQAKQRIATEPVKWLDSDQNLLLFERLLKAQQLRLIKGGRFYHVMGQNDKAKAMRWLVDHYQSQKNDKLTSIALGDSQNDREMLEQADFAGVVRKLDGSYLQLNKASEHVIYSQHPAPLGWQEIMEQLFGKLNFGVNNE